MLTPENIQKIKRINVSANGELTKKRTKEVLKAASNAEKRAIDALTGLKRVSLNRVYTTGSISAKIAVAIAQKMNIDPAYLTGEADERGTCTSERMAAFLEAKGYADIAKKVASAAKRERMKATAASAEEKTIAFEETTMPAIGCAVAADICEACAEMSEDEACLLLHSLFVKAKYSAAAKTTLDILKKQLMQGA